MAIDKHVVLIGFMGAGKTTVGEKVSSRLDVPSYDTDALITALAGRTTRQLFELEGENGFRLREAKALETLLEQEPGIIATGGGIVSTALGRHILGNSMQQIVWLGTDFSTTRDRVAQDQADRPLFDDVADAERLFYERYPLYDRVATAIVDATLEIDEVTSAVIAIAEFPTF